MKVYQLMALLSKAPAGHDVMVNFNDTQQEIVNVVFGGKLSQNQPKTKEECDTILLLCELE